MKFKIIVYPLFLLIILILGAYVLQDKKLAKGNNYVKYELVKSWPNLPKDFILGNPTGIGMDTNQHIFIFHRANRTWPLVGPMPRSYIEATTILELDKDSGKLLNTWGKDLFIMPHGLTIDNENNVWVTDVGLHQIFKFNHAGKLLMKLGEASIAGNDNFHFNKPTDIAIAKDGSFYVADGYGNSRIIKFSAQGKYLFEWGKKGDKAGEFNIPHGIDLDENGNVYVADRENNRIQVFNAEGKFLNQITNENFGNICAVSIDKTTNLLLTVDDVSFLKIKHRGSDVILIDSNKNVISQFGRSGLGNGKTKWYHDIIVDLDQNIYVSDILGNSIQKFKRTSN